MKKRVVFWVLSLIVFTVISAIIETHFGIEFPSQAAEWLHDISLMVYGGIIVFIIEQFWQQP